MSKKPPLPVEQAVAEFIAQCEREVARELLRQKAAVARELLRQKTARRRRAAAFGFYGLPREPRRPYSGREAL